MYSPCLLSPQQHSGFLENDAVEIIKDKARLKQLQTGHGGSNPHMEKVTHYVRLRPGTGAPTLTWRR